MPCPRDIGPYGLGIQCSNNPEALCWLVMRWGEILGVCDTPEEAVGLFLRLLDHSDTLAR